MSLNYSLAVVTNVYVVISWKIKLLSSQPHPQSHIKLHFTSGFSVEEELVSHFLTVEDISEVKCGRLDFVFLLSKKKTKKKNEYRVVEILSSTTMVLCI